MMFFSPEITDSIELGIPDKSPMKTTSTNDHEEGSDMLSADEKREQFELPRDTYTMLFVCNCWKVSTLTVYVFILKVALYCMLFLDDLERGNGKSGYEVELLIAQALLLPIAVAMQQDLTNSLALIANAKYSKPLTNRMPGATYDRYSSNSSLSPSLYSHFQLLTISPTNSYCLSMVLRLVDGILGLVINAIVMFHATSVLSMFLNFAALHFLQSIDDIMHELCRQGFFGNHILESAKLSEGFTLPARRHKHWMRSMDSVGYSFILLMLISAWIWYIIDPPM